MSRWLVHLGLLGVACGLGACGPRHDPVAPPQGRPRARRTARPLPEIRWLAPFAIAPGCRFERVAITATTPALVMALDASKRVHYWVARTGRPKALLNDYEPCDRPSCRSSISRAGRLLVEARAFDPSGHTGDPGSYLQVLELATLAELRWDTWLQVHALAPSADNTELLVVGQSFTPGLGSCPEGSFCVERWSLAAVRRLQHRLKNRFARHHKLRDALYAAATSLRLPEQPPRQHLPDRSVTRVVAMALGPRGHNLALADSAGAVRVWDLQRPKLRRILVRKGRRNRITALLFVDGHHLALGAPTGALALVDLRTGQPRWTRRIRGGLSALALDRRGTRLAAGSPRGVVTLLGARDGRTLRRSQHHRGRVTAVAFSPDGRTLATVDAICHAALWRW
jgi:hypothetical protein